MDEQGKKNFYNVLRAGKLGLTMQNVFGMEKVLAYAEQRKTPLQLLKYILATAWWESGATMTPVEEAFYISPDWIKADGWRRKHLRYYPWYGRGLIQTTFEDNYKRMWKEIGRTDEMQAAKFLDWDVALPALFVGMEKGLYTGRSLGDYVDMVDESDDKDFAEMNQARRVVNSMDHSKDIAKLGLLMERALKAGGYQY